MLFGKVKLIFAFVQSWYLWNSLFIDEEEDDAEGEVEGEVEDEEEDA